MKTLMLVRHAKSSWKDIELEDSERPLNKRGKHNAPMMGKRLAKQALSPDLLVSSSAKRAVDTANIIAYEISYPVENIVIDSSLYLACAEELFQWVQLQSDRHSELWVVGHNPALTELAQQLCKGSTIENIPTCAFYRVTFDASCWGQLELGDGKEVDFDYPKSLE